jgi:hypothetical protein
LESLRSFGHGQDSALETARSFREEMSLEAVIKVTAEYSLSNFVQRVRCVKEEWDLEWHESVLEE